MTLGSPVQSPVHLGQPPNFSNFQSPVPTGQPPLHSIMVGQGLNTPLGQSPALAGSQMQQSNPAFLPGYLMGQPQQVMKKMVSTRNRKASVGKYFFCFFPIFISIKNFFFVKPSSKKIMSYSAQNDFFLSN